MPEMISDIVHVFSIQARNLLNDRLSKIILYGSYARGDFCGNSDIDIMILVTGMSEELIRVAEERLCEVSFDMELEKGVHISAIIKDEGQFKTWENIIPFYYNVGREGIEISVE